MAKGIRIVLVDDHKILLHGLAELLGSLPFVNQVDTCANYTELQQLLRVYVPDVLFLDLNIPPHSGIDICADIRKRFPEVSVAILTSYDDIVLMREVKRLGAKAYFLKSVDIDVIEKFLSDCASGNLQEFVCAGLSRKTNVVFEADNFAIIEKLTVREKEICNMLVRGMSKEEIMKQLNIGYDTFKTHRHNALQKLNLKNIAELVQFAVRNNLPEVPSAN